MIYSLGERVPILEGSNHFVADTDLPCHDFVDPDARNEWIVLSDFFCLIKALGIDDRVARNGFHPHG